MTEMLRRTLMIMLTALFVLGVTFNIVLAKQMPSIGFYNTSILLDGKKMPSPKAFTFQNTTYMPIFYVHNVLSAVNIKSSWDGAGKVQTWTLTAAGGQNTGLSLDAKSGSVNVVVNGVKEEQHVVRVVLKDPYSGVYTTYIPIWYIQQILNSLGVANAWNGSSGVKTWNFTYSGHAKSQTGGTTQGQSGPSAQSGNIVKLQKTVTPLTRQTTSEIKSIAANGSSITFFGHPNQVARLKPSAIFIAPPTKNYPFGVALKVISTSSKNGLTTIQTVKPSLAEVVKTIHVVTTIPITQNDFIPNPQVVPVSQLHPTASGGKRVQQRTTATPVPVGQGTSITIPFATQIGKQWTPQPNTETNSSSNITLSAGVTLQGELVLYHPIIKADINFPGTSTASFQAEQTVTGELSGGISANISTRIMLGECVLPILDSPLFAVLSVYMIPAANGEAQIVVQFSGKTFEDVGLAGAPLYGLHSSGSGISPRFNVKMIQFKGVFQESMAVEMDIGVKFCEFPTLAGLTNTVELEMIEKGDYALGSAHVSFNADAILSYSLAGFINLPLFDVNKQFFSTQDTIWQVPPSSTATSGGSSENGGGSNAGSTGQTGLTVTTITKTGQQMNDGHGTVEVINWAMYSRFVFYASFDFATNQPETRNNTPLFAGPNQKFVLISYSTFWPTFGPGSKGSVFVVDSKGHRYPMFTDGFKNMTSRAYTVVFEVPSNVQIVKALWVTNYGVTFATPLNLSSATVTNVPVGNTMNDGHDTTETVKWAAEESNYYDGNYNIYTNTSSGSRTKIAALPGYEYVLVAYGTFWLGTSKGSVILEDTNGNYYSPIGGGFKSSTGNSYCEVFEVPRGAKVKGVYWFTIYSKISFTPLNVS